jgi:hypothetical protein
VLQAASVIGWLEERGFQAAERSATHGRWVRDEIEAFLAAEGGALAELTLSFTLSRDAFTRREAWQQFVHDLCGTWGLMLAGGAAPEGKVAAGEFFRLLAETPAWREFQEAYGWPPLVPAG